MNGAQNEQQQGFHNEAQEYQRYQNPPGPAPAFNRKSPALATVLSLLPGLGQVYVGYYQQAFINIAVAAGTITILASSMMRGAVPFFGVFLAFFWLYQMIDANRRANHYNMYMAGLGGEKVPEGFEMPTARGSLLGGSVLILVGTLFILDLNFNVSMEWVENWWPVLLILLGINLVFKARKNSD